jgi:hypothetical protein
LIRAALATRSGIAALPTIRAVSRVATLSQLAADRDQLPNTEREKYGVHEADLDKAGELLVLHDTISIVVAYTVGLFATRRSGTQT